MELVEVGPIVDEVARKHKLRCRDLRKDPSHTEARHELMRRLREAGLTLSAIGLLLSADRSGVRKVVGSGEGWARPASRCATCRQLLPTSEFTSNVRKSDGLQSSCRECTRVADRRYRRRNYIKRQQGLARSAAHGRLNQNVYTLLRDTAARHGVSMATIMERAITRSLACTNCHKALRSEGSDLCTACSKVWEMAG